MSEEAFSVDTARMRKVAERYGAKEGGLLSMLEQITDLLERGKHAMGDDGPGRTANDAYQAIGDQLRTGVKSLVDGVGAASGGLNLAARNFEVADESARAGVAKLASGLNPGGPSPDQ